MPALPGGMAALPPVVIWRNTSSSRPSLELDLGNLQALLSQQCFDRLENAFTRPWETR